VSIRRKGVHRSLFQEGRKDPLIPRGGGGGGGGGVGIRSGERKGKDLLPSLPGRKENVLQLLSVQGERR